MKSYLSDIKLMLKELKSFREKADANQITPDEEKMAAEVQVKCEKRVLVKLQK